MSANEPLTGQPGDPVIIPSTEQLAAEATTTLSNGVRVAFGVSGIVALILGVIILIAPKDTASVITAIIAIYAIVMGIVNLSLGIFTKKFDTLKRVGYGVLGALFLAVGIVALVNLGTSTKIVATVVAILIGIAWIAEGVVALGTLRHARNRVLVAVFALISVIAGIVVLFAPFQFAALLWIVLGVSLIVLGVVQILRGFSFDAQKLIAGA